MKGSVSGFCFVKCKGVQLNRQSKDRKITFDVFRSILYNETEKCDMKALSTEQCEPSKSEKWLSRSFSRGVKNLRVIAVAENPGFYRKWGNPSNGILFERRNMFKRIKLNFKKRQLININRLKNCVPGVMIGSVPLGAKASDSLF